MDTPETEVAFIKAGADYLSTLQNLGFNPEGLFWAFDEVVNEKVLVLITSAFDTIGPLEISKILFKAYNAAATPREIDPFIIRLHSTRQQFVRNLYKQDLHKVVVDHPQADQIIIDDQAAGMRLRSTWIYKFEQEKNGARIENRRKWRQFQNNVTALAA